MTEDRKENWETLSGCIDQILLFSLVVYVLPSTCSNNREIETLTRQVKVMQETYQCIEAFLPAAKTENVYGNDMPEQYYEINGKRYYFVVDGKKIDRCYVP